MDERPIQDEQRSFRTPLRVTGDALESVAELDGGFEPAPKAVDAIEQFFVGLVVPCDDPYCFKLYRI